MRNEEVKSYNNFEQNFYAGKGCLDYVWVEKNDEKHYVLSANKETDSFA